MRQPILLVYPGSDPAQRGEELPLDPGRSLPMGLLCVAAALERAGFEVHVHDARAVPKRETDAWLLERLDPPPLFVGISAMTVQIPHGLAIAALVRRASPRTPLVWGGSHASLFPQTTAAHPLVDYVLPREADETLVALARRLREGEDPRSLPGVVWARDGEVGGGLETPLPDVSSLPSPAYHLVDLSRYLPRITPGRGLVRGVDVLTSRGCPYRCAFCPNELLLGRQWRRRPVDQVCADLDSLLSRGDVDHVWFMDDLFMGDLPRVTQIVDFLHTRYPRVTWEANARADMFRPGFLDASSLSYLRESGCVCLRMGAESGNDQVLALLKKDITVEQTEAAVEACCRAGIVPVLFFMMGIPGETTPQLFDTLAFMARLKRRFPRSVVCGPGLFRPYPGGELYQRALEGGLVEPSDLEGWARELGPHGFLRSTRLPWLPDPRLVEDITFSMFYVEEYHRLHEYSFPLLRRLLAALSFWRATHRYWGLRAEAWVWRKVRRMR